MMLSHLLSYGGRSIRQPLTVNNTTDLLMSVGPEAFLSSFDDD